MRISNTPLGLERSILSRPVGQPEPFSFELCSLHRLGEDVGEHVLGAQVFERDFVLRYFLAQPEVSDVDVPRYLRSRSPSLDERHAAHVVLIDDCGS